ncbi:MAG: hypothetical protein GY858_04630 [Candidatus Omnitrophica bacterium]|nr:hypothetical protein [Candidatus Omnitrophota bacterium]
MPHRSRRNQLSDSLLYHIFNRSHLRIDIFNDDDDFEYFFSLLKRYSVKFDVKIFHWVIMSNHYHFLAEISKPLQMSSFMSGLARAYVSYYKRKYNSVGSLWQGRFKSQAIEKESYYFACARYIERNPVKALKVDNAWDYKHSSAAFYVLNDESKNISKDPIFESTYSAKDYAEYLNDDKEEESEVFNGLEHPRGSAKFLANLHREGNHYYPRKQGRISNI